MNTLSDNEQDAQQALMVAALLRSSRWPHPVDEVRLVETHISRVLLAGDRVYKIKKPLDLGFLDYSTAPLRARYCAEELRLNQRLAPELYLDVVTINGSADDPVVNGSGPVLEHAVRMRRFPDDALWSVRLSRGELGIADLEDLGERLAAFHRDAAVLDPREPWGTPERIHEPVRQNFAQIEEILDHRADIVELAALRTWSDIEFHECEDRLRGRRAGGFVRECHGDLHLGNIASLDGRPMVFDGIEFNPNLRWIDVASDIAFLVMDLNHRGWRGGACALMSAWLARTGDFAAMEVLRYYVVYRAMVRAKIAAIRAAQSDGIHRDGALDEYRSLVRLAARFTEPGQPALMLCHGFSGSGKSSVARRLVSEYGAIWLRADVERHRMFGNLPGMGATSPLYGGRYTPEASRLVYGRMLELARMLLTRGYPVVVDATFLMAEHRRPFWELAEGLNIPRAMIDCQASVDALSERILARQEAGRDPSEASLAVLDAQIHHHDRLSAGELERCLPVNTEQPLVMPELLARLRRILSLSGVLYSAP